jgi:hypothetical protein
LRTPAIELRRCGTIYPNAIVRTGKSQNKPALLLANAKRLATTPQEFFRQTIAQPVSRGAENLDIFVLQPDLLVQFAIHGLFRAFAFLHAALWKLPALAADAIAHGRSLILHDWFLLSR